MRFFLRPKYKYIWILVFSYCKLSPIIWKKIILGNAHWKLHFIRMPFFHWRQISNKSNCALHWIHSNCNTPHTKDGKCSACNVYSYNRFTIPWTHVSERDWRKLRTPMYNFHSTIYQHSLLYYHHHTQHTPIYKTDI